ncbi:phospholipase-like protein [Tanacetum coccineum]
MVNKSTQSVSGPVTVCDTKPVTSSVPTEVKNTEQDYEIDELTKLVQMLTNKKVLALERNNKLGFNEDLSRLRGNEIVFGRRRKDSFGTGKENSTREEVEVGRIEDVAVGRREDVADCEGQLKSMFPWSNDYTVSRNFWLRLVCLDPCRKGWLSEEHINLWVDYMWHGRRKNVNQAMVSCYFVQLLMQNIMPLFYANGDKYGIPWSDVDQVFNPINETDQHWCLAYLDILSGLVTFYDSEDTYDYEWRDWYVIVRKCLELYLFALLANSLLVKDIMVKFFEIDNERDLRTVADTYAMCQQLHVHCHERREQMLEMQSFLHVSTSLAESYKLLEELQDFELEKCMDLMKSISETQPKECLPVILEGAKVFDKKGIHPSDYTISFKLADNVPKQGGAADLRAHDLIG